MKYLKTYEWHKDFIDINKLYNDIVTQVKDLEFILDDEYLEMRYYKSDHIMPDGVLLTISVSMKDTFDLARMRSIVKDYLQNEKGMDDNTFGLMERNKADFITKSYMEYIFEQDYYQEWLNRIRGIANDYEGFDVAVPKKRHNAPWTTLVVSRGIFGKFWPDSEYEF